MEDYFLPNMHKKIIYNNVQYAERKKKNRNA